MTDKEIFIQAVEMTDRKKVGWINHVTFNNEIQCGTIRGIIMGLIFSMDISLTREVIYDKSNNIINKYYDAWVDNVLDNKSDWIENK